MSTTTSYTQAQFEKTIEILNIIRDESKVEKDGNGASVPDKLLIYGLRQQAEFGDVTTAKPSILKPIERAMWEAWSYQKGVPQEDAKMKLVEHFLNVLEKRGTERAKARKAAILEA
ncbi:acyl-CoA-binding protein, ACBP [Pseudohyphozyma bogoriensis]|nr:acyl-CoA-binding protein, ACBP [Pseudohyphozyma bogoriensis]